MSNISVLGLFTPRNVPGDVVRVLRSHAFVCPCNKYSLLKDTGSSVCCYLQSPWLCSFARDAQTILLFIFSKHRVKEKKVGKNAIQDV